MRFSHFRTSSVVRISDERVNTINAIYDRERFGTGSPTAFAAFLSTLFLLLVQNEMMSPIQERAVRTSKVQYMNSRMAHTKCPIATSNSSIGAPYDV